MRNQQKKSPRRSGILLHPTSLPGGAGIGDLGPEAYRFVDFLADTGQSLWQVLPLGPTGYGDSPYQCFSAFAGNPLLISLEGLVNDGLLEASDLEAQQQLPQKRVDYGATIDFKKRLLWKAYDAFRNSVNSEVRLEFRKFLESARGWLEPYAIFRSIKDHHQGKSWTEWDLHLREREDQALHFWRENHASEIEGHQFFQYTFFKQWIALAKYANSNGIQIVGDLPIFVAHDSADVWANPELFHLDKAGNPTKVAGVPPDYFSETGQLWGNPLYRWDAMERTGYQWWLDRIRAALQLVDVIRLDHFRGFESYWAVPAGEPTAVNGAWEPGPGRSLFDTVRHVLGELPIIAEDLGFITEEVNALREALKFPGMRILQFAFGTDPQADSFRPYNYPQNCVVYTGTHDNDTTSGWFRGVGAGDSTRTSIEVGKERAFVLDYLGTDGSEINWDFIRLALASVARTAIIPLQDVLGLGSEARMNVPAREAGNWSWRFSSEDLSDDVRARLRQMTNTYGRNPRLLTEASKQDTKEATKREGRRRKQ